VKIHYEVTLNDLIAFNAYHSDHSQAIRRARARNVWGGPVFFIVLAGSLAFLNIEAPLANHVVITLLVLSVSTVWVLTMPTYLRRAATRSVLRLYGEGRNKGLFGPRELELTDAKLIARTPVSESATLLESIERVARTDRYTFVYLSALSAHVIPRAALGDHDYEQFTSALTERVAKAHEQQNRYV
jgi:YcxB-like protein